MTDRNMFEELMQGIDDLQASREDKMTLRTTSLEKKPRLAMKAAEIVKLRERLNVSRPLFASMLRTSPRTLERWEQDKGKPDQGSTTLLKLVEAHPEVLALIAEL